MQRRLEPGLALHQVGDEVAVQQHGALGDAGGAAGVLQERDVVRPERHPLERAALALLEHVVEAQVPGQ